MLIQGQFTVGVRVGACRGRVQEGAQALTPLAEPEATHALPGHVQSSSSGMEGQERGGRARKNQGLWCLQGKPYHEVSWSS